VELLALSFSYDDELNEVGLVSGEGLGALGSGALVAELALAQVQSRDAAFGVEEASELEEDKGLQWALQVCLQSGLGLVLVPAPQKAKNNW